MLQTIQSPHFQRDRFGNISVTKGDDVSISIEFTFNSNPLNLAGSEVFFTVKQRTDNDLTDNSAIIKKKIASFTGADNNIATIEIDHDDTKDLALRKYQYDIQYKDVNDKIKTVIVADFTITKEITNRIN